MTSTLGQLLEAHRATVVDDCLLIIDAEVADKSGLSGLAVKAGFAAIKGVKPGFVRQAVTDLLPEFADALDPLCKEAQAKSVPVGDYFLQNRSKVSQALLGITDEKARVSPHAVVRGAYHRLRGTAEKHVEASVPRLAKLIGRYSAG